MSKIGFLTDSCSDIPQELADKYGIEVVGFPINLDGTEYLERKDFTNDQFYQMMRDAQGVPTTAAITQLQWCEIYARYVDEGYTDLVHLSINSAGSSTYNNAIKAAEMLEEERPGHKMKIQIVDSHSYSMPYGWYFCECARKVRNGGELSTCVDELKRKLDCVEICLAAYSLKQMKKSGRVSAAAAVVGDLLGIRPIISLNAGVSKVEAKAAGKPSTNEYNTLLELLKNFPGYQIEIVKTAAKKVDRFKGLDYNYMADYIKSHNEELLKEFYTLRGLDENGKKVGMAAAASYGEIKMWFLEQFPEVEKMAENVNEIIAKARNAREARKNAENAA